MDEPIYRPPPGLRTPLEDFTDYVNKQYGLRLDSFASLHAFSVNRPNDFWMSTWKFLGVKASVQPTKISHETTLTRIKLTMAHAVDESIPIDQFPQFFEDARLNFAENMLSRDDDAVAVTELDEQHLRNPQKYTWRGLRKLVARYSSVLRELGVAQGDVVALIGSNCTRSLALLLAAASIGAIFAAFATDIGEKALNDRLVQVEPRVLIAESTYWYNGKRIDISSKIDGAFKGIPAQAKCRLVVVGPVDAIASQSLSFDRLVEKAPQTPLRFEQLPFNTPLVVMFSSGTTGTPKGIVHSHGGMIINGWKEHRLHNGFGPDDVHFHFSNIGWTLWNISIHAMFCGTSMVLYDGSPFFPDPLEYLKAVFAHGVTSFGAGPRYFSELQKRNIRPRQYATRLHSIVSTGAVLTPGLAKWLGEAFGPVCQISMSGGTELGGSFIHGTRSLPSYPGEIAVKALGLDVAALSPDGVELPDGQSGELVCRKPFPNMPVKFWNDPAKKRYHAAYFEAIPHVWTHGDFIKINPTTKGIYVLGRSDGTLNPSGVRFGSSEIYNILATPKFRASIMDSLVVGQQRIDPPYSDLTEQVLLFVKCREGSTSGKVLPTKSLTDLINNQIATDLTRRHVPAHIFEVDEIPYNANGKKMEIQVKAVVNNGAKARSRQRLQPQELAMLEQYEKFHHIEALLKELKAGTPKL